MQCLKCSSHALLILDNPEYIGLTASCYTCGWTAFETPGVAKSSLPDTPADLPLCLYCDKATVSSLKHVFCGHSCSALATSADRQPQLKATVRLRGREASEAGIPLSMNPYTGVSASGIRYAKLWIAGYESA